MQYGIEIVPLGEFSELTSFCETGDARMRASMLDEALALLTQFWSGETILSPEQLASTGEHNPPTAS